MALFQHPTRSYGAFAALPDLFLRGDALVGFQADLSRDARFVFLFDGDLLARRQALDLPADALMHPSRHAHAHRILCQPGGMIRVVTAYKNATRNAAFAKVAPKVATLAFDNGVLRGDPLKRSALSLAGRTGKTVAFACRGDTPGVEIDLPNGWSHAEFTATAEDLVAYLPGTRQVMATPFAALERVALGKEKPAWELAYESPQPIAWASTQVGNGIVIGTLPTEQVHAVAGLMLAQGFRPVRGARGPMRLTPATSAVPCGGPEPLALDGLTLSADGKQLRLALRGVDESSAEALLPRTLPFKEANDGWRQLVESLGGLPQ